MILIDTMQISLANISMAIKVYGEEVNEGYVRHMILNSLRSYHKQFKEEYGEMILCYDGGKNWRKEVYPQYKANRKKDREESTLDWNQIFAWIHGVKDEIKDPETKRIFPPTFSVDPNNKTPFPAQFDDLSRLHFIARSRKVTTILEI